jgi:hypothetical protein
MTNSGNTKPPEQHMHAPTTALPPPRPHLTPTCASIFNKPQGMERIYTYASPAGPSSEGRISRYHERPALATYHTPATNPVPRQNTFPRRPWAGINGTVCLENKNTTSLRRPTPR